MSSRSTKGSASASLSSLFQLNAKRLHRFFRDKRGPVKENEIKIILRLLFRSIIQRKESDAAGDEVQAKIETDEVEKRGTEGVIGENEIEDEVENEGKDKIENKGENEIEDEGKNEKHLDSTGHATGNNDDSATFNEDRNNSAKNLQHKNYSFDIGEIGELTVKNNGPKFSFQI